MIIESLVLSILIGKLRGGKIINIANLDIKKWYLFIIAFAIEFLLLFGYQKGIGILEQYFFYFHFASYTLLFIGFIFNIKNPWLDFVFVGVLLNAVVIFLNGGKMPVSVEALNLAELPDYVTQLVNNQVATHQVLTMDMTAWYLGDIIPLIPPYPLNKVISIGDLIITIGVFFLIQKAMKKRNTLFS
jgi:hypothetical protein